MKLPTRILIVALLQTAVLVAMVGLKQYTLATGTRVVLETVPIDPRSLFRGDYVRLRYAISDLRTGLLGGDDDFTRGDAIYVALRPSAPYAMPASVYHEHPGTTAGHVIVKGTVMSIDWRQSDVIRVQYGIESYFVPEGEGRSLEQPAPGETVSIEVAVDRFGQAGITAVLVNGERRYMEKLF